MHAVHSMRPKIDSRQRHVVCCSVAYSLYPAAAAADDDDNDDDSDAVMHVSILLSCRP